MSEQLAAKSKVMKYNGATSHLHSRVVDIEGKVPIANLQGRRYIVDEICADDIELG